MTACMQECLMPGYIPSKSVYDEEKKVLEAIAPAIEYWEMDANDYKGRLLDIREDLQKQKGNWIKTKVTILVNSQIHNLLIIIIIRFFRICLSV